MGGLHGSQTANAFTVSEILHAVFVYWHHMAYEKSSQTRASRVKKGSDSPEDTSYDSIRDEEKEKQQKAEQEQEQQ